MSLGERLLLNRLVKRDEEAFNEIVRTYSDRVYNLVLRLVGSPAEAEDIAQEVFVTVFKSIDGSGSQHRRCRRGDPAYRRQPLEESHQVPGPATHRRTGVARRVRRHGNGRRGQGASASALRGS